MSLKSYHTVAMKVSALFLIGALVWLTVSAPFVLAAYQHLQKSYQVENNNGFPETEEDAANPFGNNTEEKAPGGTTLSEEYLHQQHQHESFFTKQLNCFSTRNDGTYMAFHGELLVPPPNCS